MADPALMADVKQFILDHFLPGEDPAHLTETTPLVTGGILDSLGLLDLVAFLEQRLGIEFEAHEVEQSRFNTLGSIGEFLDAKTGS